MQFTLAQTGHAVPSIAGISTSDSVQFTLAQTAQSVLCRYLRGAVHVHVRTRVDSISLFLNINIVDSCLIFDANPFRGIA